LNINIYHTSYKKDYITLIVESNDYAKIEKFFNVEIIKFYGLEDIKKYMKKHYWPLAYFFLTLITIFFFTRLVINVNVVTNNKNLQRIILNELDKEGIKKYTIIKSDKKLLQIKNNILKNNKELLEWLNIERQGMKYVINIEPKVEKNKIEKKPYCHVISTKDAMITRIIASNGMEIKNTNDSVKKDDIIISGDISYNEEVKAHVCATGTVYGKTWYTINISLPKTYEEIIKKDKKRFNLEINLNDRKYKIFKSRLDDYVSEKKKIFNLFGFELNIIKEIEVDKTIREYNDEELNENINKLVLDKMAKILNGDYKIIDQKVLKKSYNNSTIDIELFIVAEEEISEIIEATIEEEISEKNNSND